MVNMKMYIEAVTYADFDLIVVGAGMIGGR
jgi:hypothetical protein